MLRTLVLGVALVGTLDEALAADECRKDAKASLTTSCASGAVFKGQFMGRETKPPGCCERPNAVPEIEGQILEYLLRIPGGNCDVINTCGLQNETGIPGVLTLYEPSRAPADDDTYPGNKTTGTTVEVSIMLTQIGSPDILTKTVAVTMYFKQFWNDPRLRWDPLRFNHSSAPLGVGMVSHVDHDAIWTPDTHFSRFRDIETHTDMIDISYEGNVYWAQSMSGIVLCDMNLQYFPFEYPVCWTDVQSFGYQKQIVQYETGSLHDGTPALEIPASTQLGVYELEEGLLLNAKVLDRMGQWDKTQGEQSKPGSYARLPGLLFELHLMRGVGQTLFQFIFFPWVLTSLVSCGANWINVAVAPARTAATIMPILALYANVSWIKESTPERPELTAIEFFLYMSLLVGCLNFAEFAFVNYLTCRLQANASAIKRALSTRPHILLFEVLDGDDAEPEDLFRALEKVGGQETWEKCVKEFAECYPLFHEGKLRNALKDGLSDTDFMRCLRILRYNNVDFDESDIKIVSQDGLRSSDEEDDLHVPVVRLCCCRLRNRHINRMERSWRMVVPVLYNVFVAFGVISVFMASYGHESDTCTCKGDGGDFSASVHAHGPSKQCVI